MAGVLVTCNSDIIQVMFDVSLSSVFLQFQNFFFRIKNCFKGIVSRCRLSRPLSSSRIGSFNFGKCLSNFDKLGCFMGNSFEDIQIKNDILVNGFSSLSEDETWWVTTICQKLWHVQTNRQRERRKEREKEIKKKKKERIV